MSPCSCLDKQEQSGDQWLCCTICGCELFWFCSVFGPAPLRWLSVLRLLRKAVMHAKPSWWLWTSTRPAHRSLTMRPNTPAVFSVIRSSRIWWSSNMPPWGTPCIEEERDEEDKVEAGDVVAILKNPKIKWLLWLHILYRFSFGGYFFVTQQVILILQTIC